MKKISKALITVFFMLAVLGTSLIPAFAATAPAQVTGVKASSVTYNSATLSWSKAKNASKYYIENYNTSTKKWKVVTNTTKTSYALTKLTTGTTYQYRIRAYRNTGKVYGKYSATVKVTPLPVQVTGLKASSTTPTSTKLTWTKVAGATSYEVYNGTKKVATVKTNTATVSKLTPNTTNKFTVKAITTVSKKNFAGKASAALSVATTVGQVKDLKAAQVTPVSAKLTWTKVTGATSYEVSQDGKKVATVTTNSATVKKLVPNTSYKYTVKAVVTVSSKAYAGKASSAVTFKPVVGQVTGLKASSIKTTSLKLSWTKLAAAEGYIVYNGSTVVTTIDTNATVSYTVSKLKAGTSYSFKVVPYYGKYNGTASATVKAVTLCSTPTTLVADEITTTKAVLDWADVSKAASYNVYNGTTKLANVTTSDVVLEKLEKSKEYTITVAAVNSAGAESSKATVTFTTPALDLSMRDTTVTNYNVESKVSTYRVMWFACPKTGDEIFKYRVVDSYGETRDVDYVLYTCEDIPNAFDVSATTKDGYTTVTWPAVENAKYYEVQTSVDPDNTKSWTTQAKTDATSAKIVLAPSTKMSIRVLAYDRTLSITAYTAEKDAEGVIVAKTPYTGTRVVRLPGKVSTYYDYTTPAASITGTDNMSKTMAVLTAVQAINNTKSKKDDFNISGSRVMSASLKDTKVEYLQKRLTSNKWDNKSMDLDAFLKIVDTDGELSKELQSSLNENQAFNLDFEGGYGTGTVTEDGVTKNAFVRDVFDLITPTTGTAYLYNAVDVDSINNKVTNLKVTKSGDKTTISFDIPQEIATPTNPIAPVHEGLTDSIAASIGSMDEFGSSTQLKCGKTTYSVVIKADGTFESLVIKSPFEFKMAMPMSEDPEEQTEFLGFKIKNVRITMLMKGESNTTITIK